MYAMERAMNTNHRAPRGRDGRERDPLGPARWHMLVWGEWLRGPKPSGYPREASEVRASESRQAQTNLRGRAKWRGRGEPPSMPKETRASGRSRIPPIDRARIGPHVDRLLLDYEAEGGKVWARALRLEYSALRGTQIDRAAGLKLTPTRYKGLLREGLWWLTGRLNWVPLEKRGSLSDERYLIVVDTS